MTTDAMTRATDAISARMQSLNAELREQGRARFRRIVAEYANRPDLFLMKSASALVRPEVARIEDACVLHARMVRSQLAAKRVNHWTYNGAKLSAHSQLLLIARYLRRFGERVQIEAKAA